METLRRLRENSDLPVIFLTSKDEQIDELFGLRWVPTSSSVSRSRNGCWSSESRLYCVAPRRGTVPRRRTPGTKFWSVDCCVFDPERHTCTWKNAPVALTVTEFLILQALASRPEVVKSRNALMDAAYDDQVYVDDRTIDSHVKRLRKKFKANDGDFDMIETLYGVGYRFKEFSQQAAAQ